MVWIPHLHLSSTERDIWGLAHGYSQASGLHRGIGAWSFLRRLDAACIVPGNASGDSSFCYTNKSFLSIPLKSRWHSDRACLSMMYLPSFLWCHLSSFTLRKFLQGTQDNGSDLWIFFFFFSWWEHVRKTVLHVLGDGGWGRGGAEGWDKKAGGYRPWFWCLPIFLRCGTVTDDL